MEMPEYVYVRTRRWAEACSEYCGLLPLPLNPECDGSMPNETAGIPVFAAKEQIHQVLICLTGRGVEAHANHII